MLHLSRTSIAGMPLLPVAVCFSLGIILYAAGGNLWIAAATLAAGIILAFFNRYWCSLALCVLLGFCDAAISFPNGPAESLHGRKLVYSGTITRVSGDGGVQNLYVRIDSCGADTSGMAPLKRLTVNLILTSASPELSEGERIKFPATFSPVRARRDLPDEIDPADFLYRKNIHETAFLSKDDLMSVNPPDGIKGDFQRRHDRITDLIYRSSLSSDAKELLAASLVGETADMSDDLRQSFSNAGIAHILAISGLHVGIIAFIVSLALWPMFITGFGRWRRIAVVLSLWIFALLTGMPPSVVRATIMASMVIIAGIIQRNSPPLNSLSLAAILILLFSPDSLFDIGFQLSFAAVLAILLFSNRLNPVSPRKRFLYNAFSLLTVSVSAMMGTGLISILYFHSFPVYFLLANILACLLLPLILSAGIIYLLAFAAGFSCTALSTAVNGMVGFVAKCSDLIVSLPGNSLDNIYFETWIIIPFIAVLVALKILLDKPAKKQICGTIAVVMVFIICIAMQHKPGNEARVYLVRSTYHTELAYTTGDSLILITTSPNEPADVGSRAEMRYRDYMGKRNIREIIVDTASRKSDRLMIIGNTSIGLISGKPTGLDHEKLNYAIVCRGFRGKIKDITDSHEPDSIIISYDIHPKRAAHYLEQCDSLGIPVIWARKTPWSFSYDSSLKPFVK